MESVVGEFSHLGKSLLNLGLAGALTLGLATAAPSYARDVYIRTGAQIAADATTNLKRGAKITPREILSSAAVGGTMTFPVASFYQLANKIPAETVLEYVGKGAAYGTLYVPFVGIYQTVDYLVRNLTFKGLGKYLKENYWSTLKRAWKTILPFDLIVALFLSPAWQIPASAVLNFSYALFGAPKKGEVPAEKKRDTTPYYVAASNVTGRLVRNTAKGFYEALYAIGSGLKDTLYKAAPKPAAPALQPA